VKYVFWLKILPTWSKGAISIGHQAIAGVDVVSLFGIDSKYLMSKFLKSRVQPRPYKAFMAFKS
jgi:hypothetical protein